MTHDPRLEIADSAQLRHLRSLLERDVSDEKIVEALLFVPDFACLILAEANSPKYSGGTAISTLERAVVILGQDSIRALADEQPRRRFASEVERRTWRDLVAHGAAIGIGAGMLASAVQLPLVGDLRTLGVIHDLGLQILCRQNPTGYSAAHAAATATSSRIVDHERFHCGTDHSEIAEDLFRDLGLPESICLAVGFHHDPLNAPTRHRYLATLLFAGECLARRAGSGDESGIADVESLEPRVLGSLRLGPSVVDALLPLFGAELRRLGIPLRRPPLLDGSTR